LVFNIINAGETSTFNKNILSNNPGLLLFAYGSTSVLYLLWNKGYSLLCKSTNFNETDIVIQTINIDDPNDPFVIKNNSTTRNFRIIYFY
jgi:hypothetical protein